QWAQIQCEECSADCHDAPDVSVEAEGRDAAEVCADVAAECKACAVSHQQSADDGCEEVALCHFGEFEQSACSGCDECTEDHAEVEHCRGICRDAGLLSLRVYSLAVSPPCDDDSEMLQGF